MSLIELMVGLTIAALLLLLAAPSYRDFIANTAVRSAAENTVNGLRRANAEAVKRNTNVRFALGSTGWSVDEIDADGNVLNAIESYKFAEGSSKAVADSLDSGAAITFNGLGRILTANPGGDKLITDVQFTTSMVSDPRVLHVVVGNDKSATGIRLCDTKFASNDPSGCPAGISNR